MLTCMLSEDFGPFRNNWLLMFQRDLEAADVTAGVAVGVAAPLSFQGSCLGEKPTLAQW